MGSLGNRIKSLIYQETFFFKYLNYLSTVACLRCALVTHLIVWVTFSSLSIQSSGSCSFQEQQRILGLFELSQEFKQQHYLAGLLLTELSAALDMESEGYGDTYTCSSYLLNLYRLMTFLKQKC